jgi:hypothetical protein
VNKKQNKTKQKKKKKSNNQTNKQTLTTEDVIKQYSSLHWRSMIVTGALF